MKKKPEGQVLGAIFMRSQVMGDVHDYERFFDDDPRTSCPELIARSRR